MNSNLNILGIFVVGLSLGLSGCDHSDDTTKKHVAPVLRLFSWEDYTPVEVIEGFQKKTGIKVELTEFASADQALAEVQMGPNRFDLICLNELDIPFYSQSRLITSLDHKRLPNLKTLQPWIKDYLSLDYLVPYQIGSTGLAVNTDYIDEASNSWNLLWDPHLEARIALLADVREVMSVLLASCGASINSTQPQDLACAAEKALALRENRVVLNDTLSNINLLLSGEKWVVQVYNGVVFQNCPPGFPVRYFLPSEGGTLWVDGFALTRNAPNPDAAYQFLNYLLTPTVGALVTNNVFYMSPLKGIEPLIDPKILASEQIYFPEEYWHHHEILKEQGESHNEYQRIFSTILARYQ